MQLTRLSRERAVDAAYNALRQAIVSSGLMPGARLNVEELAGQLGVSLTPVRGAIQRLATEGLVEIRPRSGTFVANLSLQEIEETFQIRCALECLAAELAAGRLTPQELRRLKGMLKDLRKPMRVEADRETHERLNTEFHLAILQASANGRLVEMYSALNAHIKIARIHASEGGWSARQREETAEHEAIVAGLEAGDARAAAAALRKHIYRAKDALLGALRARLDGESRVTP
jgi:GntR family transcriptional regulator, rspAB operon transcriptional repressor